MNHPLKAVSVLAVAAMLGVPAPVLAQAKVALCKDLRDDPSFPCRESGQVVYGIKELRAVISGRPDRNRGNAGALEGAGGSGAQGQDIQAQVQHLRNQAALKLRADKAVVAQQIGAVRSLAQLDTTLGAIEKQLRRDVDAAISRADQDTRSAASQSERKIAATRLKIARNGAAGLRAFSEDVAARKRADLKRGQAPATPEPSTGPHGLAQPGDQVIGSFDDRLVVRRNGVLQVLKDDDHLLRHRRHDITMQYLRDGSRLLVVRRADGTKVASTQSQYGELLRRQRTERNGQVVVLLDEKKPARPLSLDRLPEVPYPPVFAGDLVQGTDRAKFTAKIGAKQGKRQGFSLAQIRAFQQVRGLAPAVELEAVRFANNTTLRRDQALSFNVIGQVMQQVIAQAPETVFLIEGHSNSGGKAARNLARSDLEAQSVAQHFMENFGVPPENMIVQGYGEAVPKRMGSNATQAIQRIVIRNITGLLR